MEDKLDGFLGKLENMVTSWLEEFENKPVKAGLKVFILIWLVKYSLKLFK